MKILYDHQIFEAQKFGGISRYFYELIKRNNDCLFSIKFSENEYLLSENKYKNILLPNPRKKSFFRKQSNMDLSKEMIGRGEYDLFHPTYFDPYFLESIGSKPFVLTVHDMINELFPEHYPLDEDMVFYKKELIKKAKRIIAVSNTTKRDLLRFYPFAKDKVDVVYHGCSFEFNQPNKIQLPDNYLLYVGKRDVYKNFYFFVESIQSVLTENKDLYLLCTGPGFDKEELIYFEKLGLKNKILHFYANDSNLSSFYMNARMFIYPSLYEGFGIPILEAYKSKCPVILSKTDAFIEVGADSSLFFDPKDPESLRDAVNLLLSKEAIRKDLIEKGSEVEKKFSWDISFDKTCEVYRKAVD
jgi:glycosyltransferase involved in cell wall biosynthesis